MPRLKYFFVAFLLTLSGIAVAAPAANIMRNILPEADNLYELGTTTRRWLRIYTQNASTTNLTVSGLNAANCDVKASVNGVFSCGTDATGAGGASIDYNPFTAASFVGTSTATSTLSGGLYASQLAAPFLYATSTSASSTLQNFLFTQAQGTGLSLANANLSGTLNVGGASTFPGGVTITCTSCLTDANVSDTLTASDLVAGGSVVADSEVDDNITLTNITQITNRAITDTTGTLGTSRGGLGGDFSASNGWLNVSAGTFSASTSPTVNWLTATSTTATSTFAGGLAVETSGLVYDYFSGNVGINKASPATKLHIQGAANADLSQVIIQGDGVGGESGVLEFQNSSAGEIGTLGFGGAMGGAFNNVDFVLRSNAVGERLNLYSANSLRIFTNANDTAKVTIDTAGNVGIGTTSPYAKLSVVGETVAQMFTATSTTATSTFAGGFSVASSLYVLQNGNVGIGTTTYNSAQGWGLSVGTSTVVGGQFASLLASSTGATTYNLDWNQGNTQRFILSGNSEFAINATSSHPVDGGKYSLLICQDPTGSRTATFTTPGQMRWWNGTTTITATANKCTAIGMIYDGTYSVYRVVASSTNIDLR